MELMEEKDITNLYRLVVALKTPLKASPNSLTGITRDLLISEIMDIAYECQGI